MPRPLSVAVGDHLIVSDPVKQWDIGLSNTVPPSVVMTASLQSEKLSIIPDQGITDGAVALHIQKSKGAAQ